MVPTVLKAWGVGFDSVRAKKGVAMGRLTRLELRDAWSSGSSDFTPWLAQPDNIAMLGEAICQTQKESQNSLMRPTTPPRKETWPELNQWMAQTLSTMHGLFSPMVKGLNAAEYMPSDNDNQEAAPAPGCADGMKDNTA